MRISGLSCAAFGCLAEMSFPRIPDGPVVFLGPNEAGKSTLFHVFETLLFGFTPVRDFPYRPWKDGPLPEIRAGICLDSGESLQVWRKLNTGPQGRLIQKNQVRELRNQALPWTGHVNRQLYRALYALSQADMLSLSREEQDGIQNRLLSSMGNDLFRPLSEVRQELDERAAKLWRADNRGKPAHRQLNQDLQAALSRRRRALEQDRMFRDRARRLEEVEAGIDALEHELAWLRARVRQSDELLPVRRRLDRISRLKSAVGDRRAVKALPQGLRSEYQRLGDREARAGHDLDEWTQKLQAVDSELLAGTAQAPEAGRKAGAAQNVWRAAGVSLGLAAALSAAGWKFQQSHALGAALGLLVLGCSCLVLGAFSTRRLRLQREEQSRRRKEALEEAGRRREELSRQMEQAEQRIRAAREEKDRFLDRLRKIKDRSQETEERRQRTEGPGREEEGAKGAELGGQEAGGGEEPAEGAEKGPGDPAQDVEGLLERGQQLQKLLLRLEDAEEELERSVPDLGRVREEIQDLARREEAGSILDPDAVEGWRVRLDSLEDPQGELQRLREERVQLRLELERARELESVSDVDGEIAELRDRMRQVRFDRDRHALMSAVLQEAERRFRQKHQPDVVVRAGKYLKVLTRGRYQRLALLEGGRGGDELCVETPAGGYRQVGPPLSRGTLDQIQVSFRLAVVDHLDHGQETLPLFLDEVLLNWDRDRLDKGLEVLKRLAGKRQVGIFTCHEWLAEACRKRCGAAVFDLDIKH
jgi:uncharacterized protein YhaN